MAFVAGPVARADAVTGATVENAIARSPRVALLVDEPDLEALLVAGFSGVETLGRAELPKLAAERLLAGGSLGLTNAEVALVVERSGDRGVVKVVQCESGATVVVLELPKMPVEETARWIVARTRPLLGAVADPMRPRISLPGLRFVTDSAENRSTERAINLILTARLQARGAVVLERWRMGDLVFEKSLAAQESAFWKAAEIVDGSVSAAGGKLTARVRIRDAAGTETMVQAEGGTAEDLVEDVSTRVLAARWKMEVGTKQETEAAAFLAEAKWMLEHGLPREAWQATESALALGVEARREAEMLRVKAAAMCAYPDDLKRPHTTDGGYRKNAFPPLELAMRVSAATEAMLLAGDYWEAYPTTKVPEWWIKDHPANIAVYSLYTGLRLLRAADDMGEPWGDEVTVCGLRDAIRRNVELLQHGSLGRLRLVFYSYLANYAGYWNETPEQAVAFYRMILAPDFYADNPAGLEVIRDELGFSDQARPPLLIGNAPKEDFPRGVGSWRVPRRDEARARAVWKAFMDELDHSPHVLNRADGLALRWRSTADNRARLALTVKIVDFVSDNIDALSGPQGRAIFEQLIEPLRDVNRSRDLASAQAKLVRVFLSLIGSESEISGHIISRVWVPFADGNINIREEQGRELLAALDARRAKPSISKDGISAINSARSAMLKRFPSLRPAETMEGVLAVQSLWIAAEHTPDELRGQVGFSDEAAVWQDGSLWVLDPFRGRLWKIDPQSGGATILSPENRPQTTFGSLLVAWGKRFAITAEKGVWVLDEAQTRWDKLDLPDGRYQIAVAHGDLWAASGEPARAGYEKAVEGRALYRISPKLVCDLIASSRRRPAEHPLDIILARAPFYLSSARDGGVIIGSSGEGWHFIDSTSGLPPKRPNEHFTGNFQVTSTPGLIIRTKHREGDRNGLVRAEFLDANEDELLLSDPKLVRPERARFPYPKELESLPASEYSVTWSKDGLEVLGWASRGSPWGASEAWIVRIDAAGCVATPLRFVWPADGDQRARAALHDSKVFSYPHPDARGLIATDHGLVITGRAMDGFWFIPKEDLDARRKVMRAGEGK